MHDSREWKVWKLAPESDAEERVIIVSVDGEDEITGIVYDEEDAHHIVDLHNQWRSTVESRP